MKYKIKTYGCKLNQAETGNLEKILSSNFKRSSLEDADIVVINSCGVIKKTERKILKEIHKFKKAEKEVIVTGCLPTISKEVKDLADLTIEGNDPKKFQRKLSELHELDNILNFEVPTKKRKDSASIILPIARGCLGNCSYCSAKIARGNLESFPVEEVVMRAKKALNQGIREIQLTSQDLGVYGMETGKPKLIELINQLIAIEDNFKIKLGMMNPGFIDDFFDDFLKLFKSDKLYNFLHLPVQSGDKDVLRRMNRKHTAENFIKLVDLIRNRYNNFLISTDIIVGFPGETEEDFSRTIDLIKETRPHIVNITRYSERPGTKAAEFKDMPSKIKKERSRKLTKLAKKIRIEDNQKMMGEKFNALIVRKGKNDTKLARIFNGKAVVLNKGKIGKTVDIQVTDYKHNYLVGKVIS